MDIVYIEQSPLFILAMRQHISYLLTSSELSQKTSVWYEIADYWSIVYIGVPQRIITDQGSQIRNSLVYITGMNDVNIQKPESMITIISLVVSSIMDHCVIHI